MEITLGGSMPYGKVEIGTHIVGNYPTDIQILDIGAGGGTYAKLLPQYKNIDAVDVWEDAKYYLGSFYRNVYITDVMDFEPPQIYDLAILGDVLEHLSVDDAQELLKRVKTYARDIIIGVPYMYEQDAIYGNEHERHLQPDLTHDVFMQRYPEFELLFGRFDLYGFYKLKRGIK